MNTREYKSFKKKWEGVKKKIFLALQNEKMDEAYEELERVRFDPDFYKVPAVPEEIIENPGSPINELLVLLAHKKIFFTNPKKTEEILIEIKEQNNGKTLSKDESQQIEDIQGIISKIREEQQIPEFDNEGNKIYINIDGFPHFPVERNHAIPFIEKLIEYGADPLMEIDKKGSFYKKLLAVDSESMAQYVLDKVDNKTLFSIDARGIDWLGYILENKASKSFDVFVKEKEDVIEFNKNYVLMAEQNLLHLSMANYLTNESGYLIVKGTSLTQRGYQGSYPADLIPNLEIATGYEQDKGAIREDNPILKELSLFVPEGFKPFKAAIPASKADEYFEEMKEATKFQLKKERELSSQKVSKYRTEF